MKDNHKPNRKRLTKGHKVTVNDLLTRDDINTILEELENNKHNIADLVVMWIDKRDNIFHWRVTADTLEAQVIWMLQALQFDIFTENREDGEE